ncbi:hypothetical protein CPB83DRAFT_841400 [Crepidotus variabilis]|uniref:Uncharacterized protein n=1 Tax=Crepidotus variabilis TaxID=179855 RepID=A0A9P6E062_9AGAR|nr:hypothetical protein CPB83DRAFT_841400 [Crepidotus variabilis]
MACKIINLCEPVNLNGATSPGNPSAEGREVLAQLPKETFAVTSTSSLPDSSFICLLGDSMVGSRAPAPTSTDSALSASMNPMTPPARTLPSTTPRASSVAYAAEGVFLDERHRYLPSSMQSASRFCVGKHAARGASTLSNVRSAFNVAYAFGTINTFVFYLPY